MKNYIKYLLVLLLVLVIPFKVSASEVTNVFIDKDNHLTFTGVEDYEFYKAYIKYGNEEVYTFNQNLNDKSDDLYAKVKEACDKLDDVCPDNYVGDYTLELVALDNDVQVESTRTTKSIKVKHEEYNGNNYYKVDVVGNETKYTITLDPADDIQGSVVLGSNFIFGQHVVLGSFESYGFEKQPKKYYLGWTSEDFNVTHDMTVEYVWEPMFTMSFNFNGGILNGQGTYEKEGVGYAPSLSLENLMSAFSNDLEVIPPVGKELDYVKINGVTTEIGPENGFMFNQDTEIVYYWKWSNETIVHTITLTDGFDNTIGTVEVADGEKVAQPATPIKGRLLFACWNLGDSCYNFQNPVTSDLTLDAYWNFNFRAEANVKDAAVFTYNGSDYPNSIGSAGSYHENEILGVDQREINGYVLKEWRLDSVEGTIIGSDSSEDFYIASGGHLKIKQTLNSSNHVFYAIYEKTKVAVNFVTNGGSAIETQYVVPGEYATRPGLHDSVKEGYLLGDWYTDHELTNKFNFSTPIQSELTLYASWNVYLTEVRGTVGRPVDGFTADTNVVSADPDKYTFDFQCWYLTQDGYPHIEGDATFEKDKEYEIRFYVVPKPGYAVDYDTEFYLNNEETSSYGSAEARQIRWIATDPVKVDSLNVTGIVKPTVGSKSDNSNIRITTEGLKLENAFWTEESSGNELSPSDKFVQGKRYILHLLFNTTYGHLLDEEFNEDALEGATDYLKVEFVDQVDVYDMQIFYEAHEIVAPSLKITASNNKVTLTWNEQTGVSKAEVYRSTDNKKFTKLETVKTNSYEDKSLTYGKTYYYKVKVYGNGKWTGYSNVVKKKIVPNKVNNLQITSVGSNNIKLSWDKVSVTGYEISRSTDNKTWTKIKTITDSKTLEFNNKDLKANKTYYYKIRAYKTVSGTKVYGSYSNVVSIKTAPAKSTIELILKDYNAFNIKFSGSKGATYYRIGLDLVEGFNSDDYEEEMLNTVEELSLTNIPTGITVYARIKACNKDNKCSGWNKTSLKITPKTPKLTVKSTTTKKVKVTVGSVNGADGYRVYRSTSKNGKYELVKEILNGEEMTFNNKTKKGVTYYYKVRSYKVVDSKKVYSPFSKVKTIKSK